jgi:hypothetical protein
MDSKNTYLIDNLIHISMPEPEVELSHISMLEAEVTSQPKMASR